MTGKPYEPSECSEAFEMLRAAPVLEIPYPEMVLRVIQLEFQVEVIQQRLAHLEQIPEGITGNDHT